MPDTWLTRPQKFIIVESDKICYCRSLLPLINISTGKPSPSANAGG
jgi:hypothetical protein